MAKTRTLIVNSEPTLSEAIGLVRSTFKLARYFKLSILEGRDRSLEQNAIAWAWYAQIAAETGEGTPQDIHRLCKLQFGVPILRAENADFLELYDTAIKNSLSYEQKIKAMDFLPVTRVMTVKQMSGYLEAVQEHYAGRGVDAVVLEFPSDE